MDKVKVRGIHHIAIKAKGLEEFDKTLDFYCNLLDMPVVRSWGEGEKKGVMVDTGAGLLEIFANGDDIPPTSLLRHIAFEVENTDICVETVEKAAQIYMLTAGLPRVNTIKDEEMVELAEFFGVNYRKDFLNL